MLGMFAADSRALGNEPSGFIKRGEFLDFTEELSASQDGLCPMELEQHTVYSGKMMFSPCSSSIS